MGKRMITAFGKTQCCADHAKEHGIHPKTYRARLRAGMDPEEALTVPVNKAKSPSHREENRRKKRRKKPRITTNSWCECGKRATHVEEVCIRSDTLVPILMCDGCHELFLDVET